MSMEKDFKLLSSEGNEITLKEKFSKHLVIVLKEMCKRVGANYNKVYFSKEGWFNKYTWTEEEYNDFLKWLVDYLYKSNEARKELLAYNYKTKKYIRKAVDMFGLCYGWKFTIEEKK